MSTPNPINTDITEVFSLLTKKVDLDKKIAEIMEKIKELQAKADQYTQSQSHIQAILKSKQETVTFCMTLLQQYSGSGSPIADSVPKSPPSIKTADIPTVDSPQPDHAESDDDETAETEEECEESQIMRSARMPAPIKGDPRKTRVYIDLPNVVRSIVFEAKNVMGAEFHKIDRYRINTVGADKTLFFEPLYIEAFLKKYVWIYPNVDRIIIYSIPKFGGINDFIEELREDGHPEIELIVTTEGKYRAEGTTMKALEIDDDSMFDKFDNAVIDAIWDFAMGKDATNKNYARVILFTGDLDFSDAVDQIIGKNIKVHLISHLLCFNGTYRKTAVRENRKMRGTPPTNGELNFMYHLYLKQYLDEWIREIGQEAQKDRASPVIQSQTEGLKEKN